MTAGLRILTWAFLAVSIPVETVYSWGAIVDPYYLIKLVGWALLIWGALQLRARRGVGLGFMASGWGWFAANFGRAVADRVARMAHGEVLGLGSIELWFAGSCLLLSLVGQVWSLALISRRD